MAWISDILLAGSGLDIVGFAVLCAVSFLASLISASMGLGGGMLMLAVMALYIAPAALVPLHAAVQLGSNTGRAILMLRNVMTGILPAFVLGSIIGVLAGGQLVVVLPVLLLKAVLAIFILYTVWVPKFSARKPGQKTIFAVGTASSFATMFVGATGPLVAPFVAASSNERREVVATHAMLMTLQHLLKLLTFGFLGFAFQAWLALLAGLLLCGFAGTWVGMQGLNKLPEQAFRVGLKVVLTIIALRLLWDAAGYLTG